MDDGIEISRLLPLARLALLTRDEDLRQTVELLADELGMVAAYGDSPPDATNGSGPRVTRSLRGELLLRREDRSSTGANSTCHSEREGYRIRRAQPFHMLFVRHMRVHILDEDESVHEIKVSDELCLIFKSFMSGRVNRTGIVGGSIR